MKNKINLLWCIFLISIKSYPAMAGNPPESVDVYKQPLSLQELCFKPLELYFASQMHEEDEEEIIQNIAMNLPCEVIEKFAHWCLKDDFAKKELPLPFFKHWGIKFSGDPELFVMPAVPIALIREAVISPSGQYCACLLRTDNATRILIQDNFQKQQTIYEKVYNFAEKGSISFYDDKTFISHIKKAILIRNMETGVENEISFDQEIEKYVFLQDLRYLIYEENTPSLALRGFTSTLKIYDLIDNQQKADLGCWEIFVILLESNKKDQIAIESEDGKVLIWHINAEGALTHTQELDHGQQIVKSIKFDPSSSFLITSSANLKIWDLESGQEIYEKQLPKKGISNYSVESWGSDKILIKARSLLDSFTDFLSFNPKSLRLGLFLKKSLIERAARANHAYNQEMQEHLELESEF